MSRTNHWDNVELYDYTLPEELIATHPLPDRDASRLLVLDRRSGSIKHRSFRDLPELLRAGDCVVFNDSRVIPARLIGKRVATGGRWEGLYLDTQAPGIWRLIGQTRGKIRPGEKVAVTSPHDETPSDSLLLTLMEMGQDGVWLARCESEGDPIDLLYRFGTVPLPPYIRRELATSSDWERYQTAYACIPGSVAAPTAGLHFTKGLMKRLAERNVYQAFVTLHVGIGTFRPIATERLGDHRMHSEWCEVCTETADLLNATRDRGGRLIAVGTTSVRTLETVAATGGIRPWRGQTDLFIRPPYDFQSLDGMVTNFHLPRSTLLVLVSAFAGIDRIRIAYAEAIRERYRFFSYGDAMLID